MIKDGCIVGLTTENCTNELVRDLELIRLVGPSYNYSIPSCRGEVQLRPHIEPLTTPIEVCGGFSGVLMCRNSGREELPFYSLNIPGVVKISADDEILVINTDFNPANRLLHALLGERPLTQLSWSQFYPNMTTTSWMRVNEKYIRWAASVSFHSPSHPSWQVVCEQLQALYAPTQHKRLLGYLAAV